MYCYETDDEFSTCHVWIDEFTNCLIDNATGEEVDTIVRRVDPSDLGMYSKSTGWYINWTKWDEGTEVYALYVKGSNTIEGLIALHENTEYECVDIDWMCAAPHNNYDLVGSSKRYNGVGGHLFAIGAYKSTEWNRGGACVLNAGTPELVEHYENCGLLFVGIRHRYHMTLPSATAQDILSQYTFKFEE